MHICNLQLYVINLPIITYCIEQNIFLSLYYSRTKKKQCFFFDRVFQTHFQNLNKLKNYNLPLPFTR